MLREHCLDVVLGHHEMLPVHFGALLTDEAAESHVEVGALVGEAVDAVAVEFVIGHEVKQFCTLLFGLALKLEFLLSGWSLFLKVRVLGFGWRGLE